MPQGQLMGDERNSAEGIYHLRIYLWAYGEQPYDCHQI